MDMKKEFFDIEGVSCVTCSEGSPPGFLLLQPVDEHELELLDGEVENIAQMAELPFLLAAFRVEDWFRELSPWSAPPVFGKEGFGDGARQTLSFVEGKLLPALRERYPSSDGIPVILGGYSLAGLFALWCGCRSRSFAAIAAASPSVWFDGWVSFAREHPMQAEAVYLSLGDKEEKTRNRTMAAVGTCIRETKTILDEQGVLATLVWNPGNHFRESDFRTAGAFVWCMQSLADGARRECRAENRMSSDGGDRK